MTNSTFDSVDDYLRSQPVPAQAALALVREAIRSALPQAAESITYNMPTYKIDGSAVIFFAGWKTHYSLYPASNALVQAFHAELAPFKIVNSTIRFPYTKPVPTDLVGRIAEFRAREKSQTEA